MANRRNPVGGKSELIVPERATRKNALTMEELPGLRLGNKYTSGKDEVIF